MRSRGVPVSKLASEQDNSSGLSPVAQQSCSWLARDLGSDVVLSVQDSEPDMKHTSSTRLLSRMPKSKST